MMAIIDFVEDMFYKMTAIAELLLQLVVSLEIPSTLFLDVSREDNFDIANSHIKMLASFQPW